MLLKLQPSPGLFYSLRKTTNTSVPTSHRQRRILRYGKAWHGQLATSSTKSGHQNSMFLSKWKFSSSLLNLFCYLDARHGLSIKKQKKGWPDHIPDFWCVWKIFLGSVIQLNAKSMEISLQCPVLSEPRGYSFPGIVCGRHQRLFHPSYSGNPTLSGDAQGNWPSRTLYQGTPASNMKTWKRRCWTGTAGSWL